LTGSKADPFFLLKEAQHMPLKGELSMEQQFNRENYNALVSKNY
jgi:hypothetical protein